MVNIDNGSSIQVFRDEDSDPAGAETSINARSDLSAYCREREAAERAAAKAATTVAARRAHQELAQFYALLRRETDAA